MSYYWLECKREYLVNVGMVFSAMQLENKIIIEKLCDSFNERRCFYRIGKNIVKEINSKHFAMLNDNLGFEGCTPDVHQTLKAIVFC